MHFSAGFTIGSTPLDSPAWPSLFLLADLSSAYTLEWLFWTFLSFPIAFFKIIFSQICSLLLICTPALAITTSGPGSRDPSGLELCLPYSLSRGHEETGRFPWANRKGWNNKYNHTWSPEPPSWCGWSVCCSLLITYSDTLQLSVSTRQGNTVMTQCPRDTAWIIWG